MKIPHQHHPRHSLVKAMEAHNALVSAIVAAAQDAVSPVGQGEAGTPVQPPRGS